MIFLCPALSSGDEAQRAIAEMDGKDLDGRAVRVNVAQERSSNRGGGRPNRW